MRHLLLLLAATTSSGCTTVRSLQTDLSAKPVSSNATEAALMNVLAEAFEKDQYGIRKFRSEPSDAGIKRFLTAGYALTDHYCDDFFRHTNSAKRRRQFGRGVTNDVGTAIQGVLGLVVGVPVGVVSGVGLTTGAIDKSWRNYDESFVVAPDLQSVRALVLAAQDDFRRTTLNTEDTDDKGQPRKKTLPTDYMTAQSSIIRYAGFCTFLGMQSLLTQSVDQQRDLLKKKANPATETDEDTGKTSGTTTTTTSTPGRDIPSKDAPVRLLRERIEPAVSMNAIPSG